MEPAVKASVLWGVIGALLFGVLSQAYRLATGEGIAFALTVLVMAGVGAATTGLAYVVDTHL
jgi:hypothetical protein